MTWARVNLAAPDYAEKTPPPDWCGLFYRGRRHVVSGPPESSKTVLAWIAALSVIRSGGTVAHVDFEMGPNATRELLEDLGATLDEIQNIPYFNPEGPPDASDIHALVENGVEFTVIDAAASAYDVSGLDDEKRRDAERFARLWINPLWKVGIATTLIDHVVKDPKNRGKWAIGSERKIGTADVHLGLEPLKPLSRGGHGTVKVHVHRDRPAWLKRPVVAELELISDPISHAITWEFKEPVSGATSDNGWKPTILMEKVSRYLENRGEPCSRNQIESANLGKSASHVRQAMDELVTDGYAVEQPGARGARLLTSVKPFRTSSDLVSTSSDEVVVTSSTSSCAYSTDEDEDEVTAELELR